MAETKTTAAAPVEAAATYTAAELIAAAPEKFGVSRDIATAALRMAPLRRQRRLLPRLRPRR